MFENKVSSGTSNSITPMVAFGSNCEVAGCPQQVRSSLDLGHDLAGQQTTLGAISGYEQSQQGSDRHTLNARRRSVVDFVSGIRLECSPAQAWPGLTAPPVPAHPFGRSVEHPG